jgi:SAM-dependent methyltransferase
MDYDILANFYDAFVDQDVYDEYLILLDKYTSIGSLLDIGCGTGSLSVEFSRRGYQVTATDLSEEMLQIARFRAKESQIDMDFYVYDMLDPIGYHFDTVVASMDVLNHLTDLEDVQFGLTNIYEALNPNGVFLFDILSADYIDALDGYSEDDEEFHFHWECHKGDKPHSIVHSVTIHLDDEDHSVRIYEETHDLMAYQEIIKSVGFTIVEIKTMPERTIFVVQKNENKE